MPKVECALCKQSLEGDAYLWQEYVKTPSVTGLVGVQCQHCGSVFCHRRHRDQLKFSLWSGWSKTICPTCGQPFGPAKALVRQGKVIKDARPIPLVDAPVVPVTEEAATPVLAAAGPEPEGPCPICDAPRPAEGSFCVGCGYDFETQKPSVGPATFDSPVVSNAYTPSGKVTLPGLILMGFFALVIGWFGGAFVEAGDILISGLGRVFMSSGGIIELVVMIAALMGYVAVGGGIGAVIGLVVFRAGAWGRSRNAIVAAGFGVAGGAVAFLVFMTFRRLAVGGEAADSTIDLIKLVLYLGGLLFGAGSVAYASVQTNPFCEDCNGFMKKTSLTPIPAHEEARLLDLLRAGAYGDVAQAAINGVRDADNVLNVSVWACAKCANHGCVNVEKVQTRTIQKGDNTKKQVFTRQIYSAAVSHAALEALHA